jgi:uncharacterized surface protein with fasciclin (FAS1) repeats
MTLRQSTLVTAALLALGLNAAAVGEAFAKIPQADLVALLADREALTAVLTHHVAPGKVMAADVVGLTSATTL